jgi:phosphate transport system substrate-binding protein
MSRRTAVVPAAMGIVALLGWTLVVVAGAAEAEKPALSKVEGAAAKETLQIEGSTTVGPIAEAFAEYFNKSNPNVSITVKMTGSGDGAAALIDSRCQIATMSRFMKPAEYKQAVEKNVLPCCHTVAMDGVCIIVHPSNPLKAITRSQINAIYSGKTTNWKELGGPDAPIVVISRETSSGTYEVFNEKVMGKDKIGEKAEYVNSNPQMQSRVKTTAGAIGYVGLAFLEGVKTVPVDGVTATRKTIAAGVYPISRPLFMFTNGYPELGTAAHAFCTFAMTEKGQELIEAKGYIPLTSY